MKETPVKIALVGTSCVGKTPIFEHFRSLYQDNNDIAFVNEAAREYFEYVEDKVSNPFSYQTQKKIQSLALDKEIQAEETGCKVVVTDRSVMDAPIYVSAMGDRKGAERLWDYASDWIPLYDHVLLLDPDGVPFVRDNIRKEDGGLRLRFHQEYLTVFQ